MKLEAIEKAVEVQQKAYGLLLWLQQRACTNSELFSAEKVEPFASGDLCVDWVCRRISSFPHQFRPAAGQVRAFGFVLSSFFTTSFRIAEVRHWNTVETKLVSGVIPPAGRRHKRFAEQRQQSAADELRRLTLAGLADEQGFMVHPETLERAFVEPEVLQNLTLWTYGGELVRRCNYASQGAGVHRLWLELDEKVRKNLSAKAIWKARAGLVQWLTNHDIKKET